MRIVVYGLGIIGASLCASLKRAGHTVYGRNRSEKPISIALERGIIDGVSDDYTGADTVFLALPPRVAMHELCEGSFEDGTIVADICGVKAPLEDCVYSRPRNYRYVGTHPMAGKETSGIESSSPTLFDGANLILTRCAQTDATAFETVKQLGKDMGFARIVECGAQKHDDMIALTSQLAHVVSNAYVKSPLTGDCIGFTGGSFQDMTRIAGVDDRIWAELFLLNRDRLRGEIDRLRGARGKYIEALDSGNEEELRVLLREGQEYHSRFLNKK
ncbi:MAG: prephenate dehydrogenase/arogenate dehydrogenase family protein [Clostridia bacterium]|nr:prephenate dehydrogenase/arogenate dehydrogenase family protein [Clostridia bacterium]